MKKTHFLLLFFLFFFNAAFSQNENLQDVVYLKNGSIIRGLIIEQIPNKSLKIQTADHNVFVFEFAEIEKITKEANPNRNKEIKLEKNGLNNNFKSKGFNSNLDFGVLVNGSGVSYPFRVTLGGYLGKYVQLGLGTGVDVYSHPWMPLYMDLRINVLPYRVTPQFIINGGYSMDLKKSKSLDYIAPSYTGGYYYAYKEGYAHGFYFSGGVGIKIFFPNNKTAIAFSIGDNLQQARLNDTEAIYVNNFYAKLGFQF